jgi:hypothetical protein
MEWIVTNLTVLAIGFCGGVVCAVLVPKVFNTVKGWLG